MTNTIHALDTVYQYVVHHPRVRMYRDLYGPNRPAAIRSVSDWRSLPLLTKDFLYRYPVSERCFTPWSDLRSMRLSSGTTGKKPLLTPRSHSTLFALAQIPATDARCVLSFYPSQHTLLDVRLDSTRQQPIILSGSGTELEASYTLAAQLGLDTILIPTQLLEASLPLIQMLALTEHIKYVYTTGEYASLYQRQLFASSLPHATIVYGYGASEAQRDIAYTHDTNHSSLIYRSVNEYFVESCDHEMVITQRWLAHNAMPLIRYVTGDLLDVQETDQDHFVTAFHSLGRSDTDMITLPTGSLTIPKFERAVRAITDLYPALANDFRVHYTNSRPPQINLRIKRDPNASWLQKKSIRTHTIAEKIMRELYVQPTQNYAEAVQTGAAQSMTVTLVDAHPTEHKAKTRICIRE